MITKAGGIRLIKSYEMRETFVSLFNDYVYELSRYNPWLCGQKDEHGNYLTDAVEAYIRGDAAEAFCIVKDERAIGLAVFSSELDAGEWYHDIEELYIAGESRGKGVAGQISREFWRGRAGTGLLYVLPANEPAIRYWEKLLVACGYRFSMNRENGMLVYRFPLVGGEGGQ